MLVRFGVTNFTTGPTVYRALRSADLPVPDGLRLRCCSSAGEPLAPDVIDWAEQQLGVTVRDHYGQTETGMTVANAWHPDLIDDVVPGSMGRALPGWTIEILDGDSPAPDGATGRVAVDLTRSPLMAFTGYRTAPERTAERFTGDGRRYLTGDVASRTADGRLAFGSRDDDVILMAGYRIGPFEVETVLARHPAVLEAAVVGEPDELRGEVVVAHVVLGPDADADADATELIAWCRERLARFKVPERVLVRTELPRTSVGKIRKDVLRAELIAEDHKNGPVR